MSPTSIMCLVLVIAGKAACAVYLYREAKREEADRLRWALLGAALDVLAVVLWFSLRPSSVPPPSVAAMEGEAEARGAGPSEE